MLNLLIVENNEKLRQIQIIHDTGMGEDALEFCLAQPPDVVLMDVQLAGAMNGIETAVTFPNIPFQITDLIGLSP